MGPLTSARTQSAAIAMLAAGATAGLLAAASYANGVNLPPALIFLDPRRQPTANEAIYSTMAEYALRSNERNDVLFIGDSTCAYGVDPIRFEKLTGLRAYDCGTLAWMGPGGFSVLLDGYVSHHPAPRVVVLTLSPFVMEAGISVNDPDTTRHFVDTYAPRAGSVSVESLAFYAKRGAINLLSRASDPRDLPIQGDENKTCRTLAAMQEAGRGFVQLPGEHGRHVDRVTSQGPLVRDDWRIGIASIAEMCRARGVKLMIQFAPIAEAERNARDWSQLERWADSLEGVVVARPLILPYAPEFMWDGIHLNARGVERFMPTVAKDVQAALK